MDTFRESSEFLDPIGSTLLFVSNLFFSLITLKYWKPRIINILMIIAYPIVCTASLLYASSTLNEPSAYVVLFIVSMISLIILLKVRLEEAIFLSIFQLFHMIFSKAITAGVLSLLFKKNMFQLFSEDRYFQLIMCIAHGLLAVLFCIYYLAFNKNKISAFFLAKGQVYHAMIIHIILSIYMLFTCYNFYFNLDLIWFSFEQVFTALTLYSVYLLTLKFNVRIPNLIQNEIREENENLISIAQLANFNSLPNDIKEEITISNLPMIKALFYEFKNICKSKNIDLQIEGTLSEKINASEKELYSIFSNLLKNALEAVLKIDENQNNRKINLKLQENNKRFNILISNTYKRKPIINDGNIESSKKYTEFQGLGIGYVKQILDKIKGKFNFKINDKEKIFTAELSLKMKK